MFLFAIKSLLSSPVKLALIIVGVAFSTLLVIAQMGIFYGFMGMFSNFVGNADADLWVTFKNSTNYQSANPFAAQHINRIRAMPGTQAAGPLFLGHVQMRNKQNSFDITDVIGFDPTSGVGRPWNVTDGNPSDLKLPMSVFIDESAAKERWGFKIGDSVEINGKKLRVAGHTRGIKLINGTPYIFCSEETFRRLEPELDQAKTHFILIKLKPETDHDFFLSALRSRIPKVDVQTRDSFKLRTEIYWMFQTGVGYGYLFTACLALLVGTIIVGQVLYSNTVESLADYGTLKALGVSDGQLYQIVLSQAFFFVTAGFGTGMTLAWVLKTLALQEDLQVLLDWRTMAESYAVIGFFCALASLFAIRKAITVDPAIVFRG